MTALYPRTSDHAYSHMAPLGRCDNFHHTARCCVPQIWTFLSLEEKGDSGQPLFGLSDDDGSLFESQFSFMPRLCRNNVRDVFKPTVCSVTVFTASPSLLPILLQSGCQQKSEWEPFTACNHAAHAHQSTVKSYSKTSLGPQKLSPCPIYLELRPDGNSGQIIANTLQICSDAIRRFRPADVRVIARMKPDHKADGLILVFDVAYGFLCLSRSAAGLPACEEPLLDG